MIPHQHDLAHLLIAAHVTVGFGEPHPYPGCYLWVDDNGRIAYVGTSENVQARVKSEQAAAHGGALFPLAVGIRSHALTPLAVYVLEFSARLAWARLIRERSFLDDGRFQHPDDVLNLATLTPRNLEEFIVRSLARQESRSDSTPSSDPPGTDPAATPWRTSLLGQHDTACDWGWSAEQVASSAPDVPGGPFAWSRPCDVNPNYSGEIGPFQPRWDPSHLHGRRPCP